MDTNLFFIILAMGPAMYVKGNSAEYKIILHGLQEMSQLLEMQGKSLILGLFYNPTKKNNKCFISKLEKILKEIPSTVNFVLRGDRYDYRWELH